MVATHVHIIVADDMETGKKYIVKVFANYAKARAFLQKKAHAEENSPYYMESWSLS